MTNHQININDTTPVDQLKLTQLNHKYLFVKIISTAIIYIILAALALLLPTDHSTWQLIAVESTIAAVALINLLLIPKAFKIKGYALRQHDITYRSGLIFQKTTTLPYDRVQQININQNPLSKLFKLCSIEIVNGAQSLSSLTIPGLPEEQAQQLKDLITQKIQSKKLFKFNFGQD